MIECRYMSVEIMSVIHVSSKSMIIAISIWVAVVELMTVSVVTKFMVIVAKVVFFVTPSVTIAKVVVIMTESVSEAVT